jgi:hypothetical protein
MDSSAGWRWGKVLCHCGVVEGPGCSLLAIAASTAVIAVGMLPPGSTVTSDSIVSRRWLGQRFTSQEMSKGQTCWFEGLLDRAHTGLEFRQASISMQCTVP